jgi:hypothetical protein
VFQIGKIMQTNEQEFTALLKFITEPNKCSYQDKTQTLTTLILSLNNIENLSNRVNILANFITSFDLETVKGLTKNKELLDRIQKNLTWHDVFAYEQMTKMNFRKLDLMLTKIAPEEFVKKAQSQTEMHKFHLFFNHALTEGYQLKQEDWDTMGEKLMSCFRKSQNTYYTDLFLNAYFSNTQVNIKPLLEKYFDGFMNFFSDFFVHKKQKTFIKINNKSVPLGLSVINQFYESFDPQAFKFNLSKILLNELAQYVAKHINDANIEKNILNMTSFLDNKQDFFTLLIAKNAKAKKLLPIAEKMLLEQQININNDSQKPKIKL